MATTTTRRPRGKQTSRNRPRKRTARTLLRRTLQLPGKIARARVVFAWVLLVGSMVGWPLSALTVARHEPQFVLGLSWLAITLTAMDILQTTSVRATQEEEDGAP
jgi:hypothetical protein